MLSCHKPPFVIHWLICIFHSNYVYVRVNNSVLLVTRGYLTRDLTARVHFSSSDNCTSLAHLPESTVIHHALYSLLCQSKVIDKIFFPKLQLKSLVLRNLRFEYKCLTNYRYGYFPWCCLSHHSVNPPES